MKPGNLANSEPEVVQHALCISEGLSNSQQMYFTVAVPRVQNMQSCKFRYLYFLLFVHKCTSTQNCIILVLHALFNYIVPNNLREGEQSQSQTQTTRPRTVWCTFHTKCFFLHIQVLILLFGSHKLPRSLMHSYIKVKSKNHTVAVISACNVNVM